MKRILSIGLLLYFTVALFLFADEQSDAENMVKTNVNKVLSILSEKNVPKEQKRDRIVTIVTHVFDVSLMAKLCLGKEHWTSMSQDQQEAFTKLFVNQYKEAYADKIEFFNNEKVLFEPAVIKKKKGEMQTYILSKGNKYSMLYKVYLSQDGWKVYDVEIEGVSMVQTYRSQYRQFLSKATVTDLMDKLKETEKTE